MPVVIPLAVELFLIVAFLVAFGFLYLYRGTFKKVIVALADLLDHVSVPTPFGRKHLLGAVSRFLRDTAEAIDHAIAAVVVNTGRGAAMLWNGLARQAQLLGRLLGDLADTIGAKFHHLLLAFPPALVLWAAVRAVQALPRLYHRVAHLEQRAAQTITRVVHEATQVTHVTRVYVTRTIREAAHAAAGVVTAPMPWVRGELDALRDTLRGVRSRLGRIDRTLAAAGAAALVGAALARLSLGWLRCPRVGRVGRQVCGMDYGLLESLVADTVILAGTISLVEFAEGMQAGIGEVAPQIQRFWRAG